MSEIKISSSFEEILGKSVETYSDEERRERWKQWQNIALEIGDPDCVSLWLDSFECQGCIHLDEQESWCRLQGLPCTVNPVLSFRNGIPGMACMGAGKETAGGRDEANC